MEMDEHFGYNGSLYQKVLLKVHDEAKLQRELIIIFHPVCLEHLVFSSLLFLYILIVLLIPCVGNTIVFNTIADILSVL